MNAVSGLKKSWVALALMLAPLLAAAADVPGLPEHRPDKTLLDDTHKGRHQILVQDPMGHKYVQEGFLTQDSAGLRYVRVQDSAGSFKYLPVSEGGSTPQAVLSAGGFTDFAWSGYIGPVRPDFGPSRLVESWPSGVSVAVVTNPPGGIGLLIGDAGMIKRVVTNTPAAKAGVREGDVITAIDEQPITGVALHDVALRLRGEIGSEVEITLSRPGQPEPLKIKLRREAVSVPSGDFGL